MSDKLDMEINGNLSGSREDSSGTNQNISLLPYITQRTRRDILKILYKHPDYAQSIGKDLGLSAKAVSHHLKEFEKLNLARRMPTERRFKYSIYEISEFGRFLLEKGGFV